MDFFNNIILSTENLRNNIKIIKKQAGSKKICAMVKANAYGHDLKFAVLNLKNHVDFFGVANAVEAMEVRKYAQRNKILVCGKVQKSDLKIMLENNISLTVFSKTYLFEVLSVCKKQNLKANIHLKLNTGMNRLGIKSKKVLLKILDLLNKNAKYLSFEGIYSHLFNSENVGLCHTQYNRFLKLLDCINIYNKNYSVKSILKQKIGKYINNLKCKLLNVYAGLSSKRNENDKVFDFNKLLVHLENSEGLFNNVDYLNVCNMCRVGIALYGLEIKNKGLKPVLSLKSKIVQIQNIKTEDYVGYGKMVIEKDGEVAIVPIGYADGIIRAYKNHYVVIKNNYHKILNVCMDSILIDVSNSHVKVGDDVEIISTNLHKQNCANMIAKHLDTISYEVVTNINHNRMNLIIDI